MSTTQTPATSAATYMGLENTQAERDEAEDATTALDRARWITQAAPADRAALARRFVREDLELARLWNDRHYALPALTPDIAYNRRRYRKMLFSALYWRTVAHGCEL